MKAKTWSLFFNWTTTIPNTNCVCHPSITFSYPLALTSPIHVISHQNIVIYLAMMPWTSTRRWSGSCFAFAMPLDDVAFPWVMVPIAWALWPWCLQLLFVPAKVYLTSSIEMKIGAYSLKVWLIQGMQTYTSWCTGFSISVWAYKGLLE